MPTFDQLPGTLNVSFRKGDTLSVEVDFTPTSFSGSTVSASLISTITGGVVRQMATTLVNASQGIVNVSLTQQQSAALDAGTYKWELTATDGTAKRSYMTGFVEVST
jgi:hypothetical protein